MYCVSWWSSLEVGVGGVGENGGGKMETTVLEQRLKKINFF